MRLAILILLPALHAQDFDHFEVASVRLSQPLKTTPVGMVPAPIIRGGVGTPDPSQIAYQGIWLNNLIITGYDVQAFPSPIDASRIGSPPSVTASGDKIPAGATKAQFNVMLHESPEEGDRFKLEHP